MFREYELILILFFPFIAFKRIIFYANGNELNNLPKENTKNDTVLTKH